MKIISTVPSQTELLYDLGLHDEVVGITKFCVHPKEWFRSKRRIGGTKDLKIDLIKSLEPDLVIANKEENVKEQIESISSFTKVYLSEIKNIDDNYQLIDNIAALTNKQERGKQLKNQLRDCVKNLSTIPDKTAVYLIWKNPLMTVGGDSYIHFMLELMGIQNLTGHKKRYPEIKMEEIKSMKPDLLLLSSEPFPFKEKHLSEFQAALPDTRVLLVDGELFSWYGSRLIKLYPEAIELRRKIHLR